MDFERKCLLVLGGGPAQVPGIRKAKALGCRVVSVDYAPENPGHRHADAYENCNTRDPLCVLRAARKHGIDGIVAFRSDVALATWASVAEALGLPGVSPSAVAVMADKGRFRAFQRAAGLAHPGYVIGASIDALRGRLPELRWPVFVKPVDSYGSKGVSRLADADGAVFAAACDLALSHSPTAMACVEEAVSGIEVGGDAFLQAGRLVFLGLTRKYLDGVRVTGHLIPDGLSAKDRERVAAALSTACARLGYGDGALNYDVMLGPAGVTILEMSPRNGGNGLTALIHRATGFDIESAMIAAALGGEPPPAGSGGVGRGCGVAIFGAPRAGRLRRLPTLATLRAAAPEVYAVEWLKAPGEVVERFMHSGQAVLQVFFDCAGAADYARISGILASRADIRVDGAGS